MSQFISPEDIDALIHERVRLGIMSALAAAKELSFTELKMMLKVTDGNLSVHARVLEKGRYIKLKKSFIGRRPRTTLSLTPKGRDSFRRYIAQLEQFVKKAGG